MATFEDLFQEFEKAPMGQVLELLLEDVSEEERKRLTIESVSYSRFGPQAVTFEVNLFIDDNSDKWISICVQRDKKDGEIWKQILSRFNLGYTDSMRSIEECIYRYTEAWE